MTRSGRPHRIRLHWHSEATDTRWAAIVRALGRKPKGKKTDRQQPPDCLTVDVRGSFGQGHDFEGYLIVTRESDAEAVWDFEVRRAEDEPEPGSSGIRVLAGKERVFKTKEIGPCLPEWCGPLPLAKVTLEYRLPLASFEPPIPLPLPVRLPGPLAEVSVAGIRLEFGRVDALPDSAILDRQRRDFVITFLATVQLSATDYWLDELSLKGGAWLDVFKRPGGG